MKARKRAYREMISRLKRENEEQRDTINKLWADLKLPANKSSKNSNIFSSSLNHENSSKKIKELEAILAEKRQKFENLKDIITDYLQKAEAFEEQLIAKEKENEMLLLSIQRLAESQKSELSLSQLESSKGNSAKLTQKSHNSSNSRNSNSRKASSNNGAVQNKKQNNLIEVLNQKRTAVQILRCKLNDAYKMMNNLQSDANLLKNVMASSNENNTEQY